MAAAALPAASNFPYPQNRTYAYGFKPAPFSGSAVTDANTIKGYYNSWIANKRVTVSASPVTYRIQAEDLGNDTVSEGISYGMLLAVYFDDQATFDGLWRYKVSKNDGLGLMNWRVSAGGGIVGAGSATDADQDIAYALYLAHYQWGSAGTFNYKSLADAEMTKIVAYDLDSNRIKPGDSFNDCRYPSYFFPNEYRVFGKEKSADLATWTSTRNNCYATIAAARNATTGLVAEQCTDTGQGGGCSVSSTQYKYNSARVPLRMAMDYVYYGDANALAELNKLASHFGGIAPGSVGDCYNLNGTVCSSNNHGAFVGPGGCSFMGNGAANLQTYYNFLMVTDYSGNYFGGAISLLSLLLLSGNMPNIGDQGAMFTPTRTSTVTPYAGTPTVTPTQTPLAFAYVFEDFENAILVNSYTYAGPASPAPTPTIAQGLSSANNSTAGGTFSDKVTVQKPTNGQYAGVGFDSSYAPASGVLNFTGATQVRISIKTAIATSIQLSIREGNGVSGGDDEVWNSAIVAVPANAGAFQVVSFNISAFTENIYNPSCASNCLTTGNNVFNLSSIKAVEIAFPSIIAASNDIYIDDISFIPSVVPTFTPTKTPFPNPYNQIYDDFESPNSLNATAPKRVTGYANTANGASTSYALDSATYVAGAASGRLNYNLGTAPQSYGGGFSFMSPYNTGTWTPTDALMNGAIYDASGAVQLQFWMNAPAGLKYQVTLQEAGNTTTPVSGADGESWYSALLTGTGTWQRVTVDIGDFVEDPYNPTCNPAGTAAPGPCITGAQSGNNLINLNAIWMVGLKLPGAQVGVASRSGTLYLDDITFVTSYKSPTITRTWTPAAGSPTPTVTTTNSASATPTRTASPTPSASRTPTPTSSATATPSATPLASTATNTPSITATGTASRTATVSVTRTSTASPSATPSQTPLASTATDTPTATLTATRTATASASPSGTPSASLTATRTASVSATTTATRTASGTATVTRTATPTYTDVPVGSSPTSTPTISPTFSVTPSSTRSATPSASPSATRSATASATPTLSASPASTLTVTPTQTPLAATPSASPSATQSATPLASTLTATPSATALASTLTASPTNVPATASATPTASPLAATATATPSATRSSTPAPPSLTATQTASPQPGSPTFTVTLAPATATPSATPTASPSGTPSAVVPSATATPTNSPVPGTATFTRTVTPMVPTATATRVVPSISGVSPNSAPGSAPQVFVVSGVNFTPGAVVVFDNADLATTWGGSGTLQGTLPAGKPAGTYTLAVRNPDGTTSAASSVVITGLATATAVPASAGGALLIDAKPFPNPNPRELRVLLGQNADRVVVKVYSRAMILLGTAETTGPLNAGWQAVRLPVDGMGHCFFTVSAERGGTKGELPKAGSFVRF